MHSGLLRKKVKLLNELKDYSLVVNSQNYETVLNSHFFKRFENKWGAQVRVHQAKTFEEGDEFILANKREWQIPFSREQLIEDIKNDKEIIDKNIEKDKKKIQTMLKKINKNTMDFSPKVEQIPYIIIIYIKFLKMKFSQQTKFVDKKL